MPLSSINNDSGDYILVIISFMEWAQLNEFYRLLPKNPLSVKCVEERAKEWKWPFLLFPARENILAIFARYFILSRKCINEYAVIGQKCVVALMERKMWLLLMECVLKISAHFQAEILSTHKMRSLMKVFLWCRHARAGKRDRRTNQKTLVSIDPNRMVRISPLRIVVATVFVFR